MGGAMYDLESECSPRPFTRSGAETEGLPAALRADCARCAGLCCVLPAFDAEQGFGFDKPAHTACRHLTPARRCRIHAELGARGFAGCVSFDCYGAGQRVTQELLPATDWRTSAEAKERLSRAYASCLALHRLMALLVTARAGFCSALDARIRPQLARLEELARSEAALAGTLDLAALEKQTLGLAREVFSLRRQQAERGAEPGA